MLRRKVLPADLLVAFLAMWCPVCGSEFQPGIIRCPDDDAELVDEPPSGPLAGLPGRSFSNWPFDESWAFASDAGTVFGKAISALGTLGWEVTATDASDRVVGASTSAGPQGQDVEVHVVDDSDGGSVVRIRVQTKLFAEDFGRCRADAVRLIAQLEDSLGLRSTPAGS